MTAIKRVDVTNAARGLWWTKRGDALAAGVAIAALVAAGLTAGTLPLAVTLAALVVGNALRLWVREVARQAEYREESAYFGELFETYSDLLSDSIIGHTPANGDAADV